MKFDVASDLLSLLSKKSGKLNDGYIEVIRCLDVEGFSYCSEAMRGMTRTLFSNKLMIAHNMLQNAIDEAKGAARVSLVAERYADSELLEKMKRHVGDELRHSKMFADAIALTGFDIEGEDTSIVDESVDAVLDFDDDLKTFLCRVHSIEVRSWTMLRMYMSLLSESKDVDLLSINPILDQIMQDEIFHVVYTGEQINRWLDEDPSLKNVLLSCFKHTNRETWHDVANMSNYLADNYAQINTEVAVQDDLMVVA